MKKRNLTKREKVLLIILAALLLGFCYFKLIHEPVRDAILDAAERQSVAETETMLELGRYQQMRKLEAELEALAAEGGEDQYELPAYDNLQSVMIQLNAILSVSREYSLTFGDLHVSESGLVSRPIRMTLTAGSYETARSIINNLSQCPYRCRISDISVSAYDSVAYEPVELSLTVTFYERTQP